jgi:hypothetical protein
VAIDNHEPSVHFKNTHLQWTRANSKKQLYRGPAVSAHGPRKRRKFVEISFKAS